MPVENTRIGERVVKNSVFDGKNEDYSLFKEIFGGFLGNFSGFFAVFLSFLGKF